MGNMMMMMMMMRSRACVHTLACRGRVSLHFFSQLTLQSAAGFPQSGNSMMMMIFHK
jgi:hypothetical protein